MSPTRKIPDEEWNRHSAEIKALYLAGDMALMDVMVRMEEKHKFQATYIFSPNLGDTCI
jgi:ubiquinone biosynthesis protein UbiJ